MKRIISQFKAVHERHQRGTIMVLTAVMISAMLGMIALAIDLGFIFSLRHQFQNGIDVAAVAGASGLRVTIEAANDPDPPQQKLLVRELAKKYASLNDVRRYADPPPDPTPPPKPNANAIVNAIVIEPSDVTTDTASDLPQVTVDSTMEVPTLFAGIVGLYS